MNTVTVPKIEYDLLREQALAYRQIASRFAAQTIERPVSSVVANFRATGKYSDAFLADLEEGLSDLRKSKVWKSK